VAEAFSLIEQETWGRMCDKVICAMGVGDGQMMESILGITAKRGRVVVTNMHPMGESTVNLNLCMLALLEKQIVGTIFGSANLRSDIPKLLKLYRNGLLDLDAMVTNTYKLGDVNLGYQDMRDGKNIRGVLVYDD
jgi:S-(hydroxymethyl)glutathione dehydrogenase/alcohol dehydrogenase